MLLMQTSSMTVENIMGLLNKLNIDQLHGQIGISAIGISAIPLILRRIDFQEICTPCWL